MTEAADKTLDLIKTKYPEIEWLFDYSYDMLSVECPTAHIAELLEFLRDDPEAGFTFLTDLCGIHIPGHVNKELGVIYHLHNMQRNERLRVKTFFSIAYPRVHTMTHLWPAANWMERETYDFFGVEFVGHPDLRRILNVDDMDYFPLRKQYPLEDGTRTDKEDEFFGR